MNDKVAFFAGMVALAVLAAFAYYLADAFNNYVDCRAREAIKHFLQDLPASKDVTPPTKHDT